jgi:hypothetical protein
METANRIKIITKTKDLGYSKVFYASEICQGLVCDTSIRIGQQYIITIAGCDIEKFHNELAQIIEKYRI